MNKEKLAGVERIFPLTPMQQALLFHNVKEEDRGEYFNQHMIELEGEIDTDSFSKAVSALSERFEIFRTRIMYRKLEKPVQVVLKQSDMEFEYIDLSEYKGEKLDEEKEKILSADRERGFVIDKDILCRIKLIYLGDNSWLNLWSYHHILMDGSCIGLIASDFFRMYDMIRKGTNAELSEPLSYQMYENWLELQEKEKALAYWKNYLEGYEGCADVPADLEGEGTDHSVYNALINEDVYRRALDFSARNKVTVNVMMQCVWGIILQAYNNCDDVVFGGVSAARPLGLKDSDRIVGMFVNTLPVRVSGGKIGSVLEKLSKDFVGAAENSYVSLGEIQSGMHSRSELVSHLYAFQNFSLKALYEGAEEAGITIKDMYIRHTSNYDLTVEVVQREGMKVKFTYNKNLYSVEYIREIADNITVLLDALASGKYEDTSMLAKLVKVRKTAGKHTSPEKAASSEQGYKPPETELEKKLAALFEKVLGVEKISITDDFFEMGGNSIKGMQLTALCEKQGIPLKLSELFMGCTIENIVKILRKKNKTADTVKTDEKKPLTQDHFKPFPTNDIQKAYIIGQDASFELGSFSPQYYTEIEGDIDIERLENSFRKVIAHQPALRSRIININEQVVEEKMDFSIPFTDASGMTEDEQREFLTQLRDTMSIHKVSIDEYPYFTVKAVKLKDHLIRMFFNMDSLCVDGFGLGMMLQEIRDAYNDPQKEFEPIDFTVRDYSVYLEELKNTPEYEEDKAYWMNRVDTLPIDLELPVNPTENIRNPRFLRQEYLLTDDEYGRLKKFAADNKVTVPSVICAAYMEVLAFWSGRSHFTVNMTVFDRHHFHKDVERMIGDFTKLIYIESDTAPTSFIEKSRKVNANIISDLEHSTFSSMEMSRTLTARTSHGKKAILPYVFTCAISDDTKEADMDFFNTVYAISRTPQVYIDNQVTQRGRSIFVNWDYPEGLFDEEMISTMFRQYIDILLNVSDDVKVGISESDREIIESYNSTELSEEDTVQISSMSLIDLIRKSFAEYPDRIAVKDSTHSITYRELDELSDKAALRLEKDNVRAGDTVGIVGNRTVETVINMIGAVKAGVTYVPINTEYPEERVKYMLEKSGCSLTIDDDYSAYSSDERYSYRKVDPESNAYIIFTSGSTGQPKGVVIQHNAAVNTIIDINRKFSISCDDVLICLASFGFDLSVYDVYGALAAGAELYICDQQKNPEELAAVIDRENITVWNSVPAMMQMLISSLKGSYRNSSLRLVLMSGDWIPVKLPSQIRQHFVNASPVSLGGATEGSIWSIYYPIGEDVPDIGSIPYGMPLSRQKMYILNDDLEYCPVGVKGEICIGGAGVAAGYINDPEKTENAFIVHPKLGYIYRTGDYGKMHREGYIEFLGRKDSQIKLHGYRVELGEIEAAASRLEGIKQAVVLLKKQGTGASLRMFLETETESDQEKIKDELRKKLPEYMIPSAITFMPQLPMTQNGKIDRKHLLESSTAESSVYRTVPANEKEKMIADIWAAILETETPEIDRSLFDIGVDSLKAIQFITEIKNRGYEISLMDIYSNDTIEKLAEAMKESGDEFTEEDGEIFEDGVL